jgi:putative oxidoreductase
MNLDRLSVYRPQMLAILRIMTALLFIAHGTSKLFNFPDTGMSPPLFSLFGLAGVLELVGGLMILVGLFTRSVAFVLAGEMAAAYFMAHFPGGFFPTANGGDAAVLFCFVFLYLFVSGPGAWSVDGNRARA